MRARAMFVGQVQTRPSGHALLAVAGVLWLCGGVRAESPPSTESFQPQRINKCIELLAEGQPIYYAQGRGGYDEGKALAQTWADYIWYDLEHQPLDFSQLAAFMRGLVAGGPTPSGHRTPAVIVTLPVLGLDGPTMKAGGWMVQQALATGIHGVHLCRARDTDAVREFVLAARYPHQKQGVEQLGVGLRGFGSHKTAATIWGVEEQQYLMLADVWPLNPRGEIMLGVKVEDPSALEHAEEVVRVPGIAFAESGPRDMSLSYGYTEGRADPPLPREVEAASRRVLAACKAANVFYLDNVLPSNVRQRVDEGVMIGAGRLEESAQVGRLYTKRKMPW